MDISNRIDALVGAGLIRPPDDSRPDEFEFAHALLQEAAYESLLRHERRGLHLTVGEILEQNDPDRREALAPILADHYLRSLDPARALEPLCRAGEAAARRFATAEASGHFARALDLLDPGRSDRARLEQVVLGLGRALELQNRFADGLRAYEWLESAARARGDLALQLTALTARAKVLATPNPAQDPPQAEAALDQGLQLARRLGDAATESRVLWNRMILRVYSGGDIREAIQYGLQSLRLAREHGLLEQTAFTLNDLGYAYTALDDPLQSLSALTEAESLWRSRENWPMLADCLAAEVVSRHRLGELERATAASDESLAISRKIANVWGEASSRLYVSYVHLDSGRPDLALEASLETARNGDLAGHAVAAFVARADHAWILASLGRPIEALTEATRLLEAPPPMPAHLVLPHALGIRGRIHLRAGDRAAARADFDRALETMPPEGLRLMAPFILPLGTSELSLAEGRPSEALVKLETFCIYLRDHHARVFLPEALYLRGRARFQIGDLEGARRDLVESYRLAEEIGLIRMLRPTATLLSRVSDGMGRPEDAHIWAVKSDDARDRIVRRIPTQALRDSFLSSGYGS